MSRSLHIHPGSSLTSLDFETGLLGRVYKDGVKVADTSAVTVTPLAGDATRGHIGNLPEVDGSTYAVSVLLGTTVAVLYYPETSYFTWRIVPYRTTGQTVASLGLKLTQNAVVSGQPLTATPGDASAAPDYIVTGWAATPGEYGLSWVTPSFADAKSWEVAAAQPAIPVPSTGWGRRAAAVNRTNGVAATFSTLLKTGAPGYAYADCKQTTKRIPGANAVGTKTLRNVRHIHVPRINGNPAPEKNQHGSFNSGALFILGEVHEKAGFWHVEGG